MKKSLLRRFWEAQLLVFVEVVWNGRNLLEEQSELSELRREVVVLREKEARLTIESCTDEGTGLLNARGIFSAGEKEIVRAKRLGSITTLVYIDLDALKSVNDRWGHVSGDSYLREFANCLRRCVRGYDIIGRVGGDEFVILFSAADESVAEQRMQSISASAKFQEESIPFSYGICASSETAELEEMIYCADRRMYERKRDRKCHLRQQNKTTEREVAR